MEEKTDRSSENLSVSAREEEILALWKERDIFQCSLDQTRDGKPYVFYDGPPFATGLPHYGHLLAGTIKDVIPRYRSMRGRYVRREWGWDCHGLPIENLIEKELGFKTKQDIEEYGIANFNRKAKESILAYEKDWKKIVPRIGRFVDMEHPYMTMDASYTESIWWAFKTLFDKQLIYEGYKSMHICPRCETTLAASEVALGYKDVKDISVYVKFKLKDEPNTYLLAWTTTPWTLPGNVALAVNASMSYVVCRMSYEDEIQNTRLIIAKERVPAVMKDTPHEVVEELSGKDLIGKSYVPVFDYYAKDAELPNRANGWKVYAADFVTTESGTGIVHIAPAFGEDDMALGKKHKLPFIQHVGMDGKMRKEVLDFAGQFVKPKSDLSAADGGASDKERLATDIAIIKYLQEHGAFFAKENLVHSYPHCWRCDWPLLNYAASSWFVAVTAIKEKLLEANARVAWVPEHIGTGRFGKWLEAARDWAISRSRYWGAPIPVWKCNKCGKVEALGSLDALRAKTTRKNRYLLMRHGEAEHQVRGIVSWKPGEEHHLTEKGKKEVADSVEALKNEKIDLIYVSPILRTKETARIVAHALGVPQNAVLEDERLTEAKTGTFHGRPIDEYRAFFTNVEEKFTKRPPSSADATAGKSEGETLEEMKARLAAFLYDIESEHEGKTILIVTHEYAVWLLEAAAKGMTNHEAAVLRDGEGEDFIHSGEYRALPFAAIPHNERYELDFHRPYADDIRWHCPCELGMMERVPEVFDCWFESGSMPFAQFHYLGNDTTPEGKLFRANFPADFIAEGLDQTRGWFYTQMVLGVALFDESPYKSVIVNGIILAENGEKMSKRLKNYPDPMEVVAKYGADALRFYLVSSPAVRGEDLCFSERGVDEVYKKNILRVLNTLTFLETYGAEDGEAPVVLRGTPASVNVLDRWIVARFSEALAEVTKFLDAHELDLASRPIPKFIDDLSTWYLRRSRERMKGEDTADARAATETLAWALFSFARLIAPFMPLLAEEIYRRLNVEDGLASVHLESWPEAETVDGEVLADMAEARRVVAVALLARAKAGIKVRQPLSGLVLGGNYFSEKPGYLSLIGSEVNVHNVAYTVKEPAGAVTLDTTITPKLKKEGHLRDLIRHVQDLRKTTGLQPSDKAALTVATDEEGKDFVLSVKDELLRATGGVALLFGEAEDDDPVVVDGSAVRVMVIKHS